MRMKRTIIFILLAALVISVFSTNCFAAEAEKSIVTYFEDGSYIVETIRVVQSRASGTLSGSKEKTYYSDAGNAGWKAVLTGTFTYTGSSSTCTASSCSVTIYDSAWYTISKSATKSGNTAYASVTIGKKLLGVTVTQVPASISLSCDKDGNLS